MRETDQGEPQSEGQQWTVEVRLRWFRRGQRRDSGYRRMLRLELAGRRSGGRAKRRCMDVVAMKSVGGRGEEVKFSLADEKIRQELRFHDSLSQNKAISLKLRQSTIAICRCIS